jgi:hypothetical protein
VVELELLQLGGERDLVRAAPQSFKALAGVGVEPVELLVVVERVVVKRRRRCASVSRAKASMSPRQEWPQPR